MQNAVVDNDNTPADNPITDEGATLGRVLFYDKKLSANGTIACASCHKQEFAFADNMVLSDGFDGGKTRRHSMSIINARYYKPGKFFWDERAASLEEQVLMPFQDEVEMGLTLEELVQKVNDQAYYPVLFKNAFGDDEINSDRISKALAQFVRSVVSFNSKYDVGRAQVTAPNQPFPNFTQQENQGKQLFMAPRNGIGPCVGCHVTEAFITSSFIPPGGQTSTTNNGLDAASTDDLGVAESTNQNGDRGKFKVPSLRNVAMRAPFMHDGRFGNLDEVVTHYSEEIKDHPNLTPALRDGNGDPVRYNFTQTEKEALVAFLTALTDEALLSDERFSDPFK